MPSAARAFFSTLKIPHRRCTNVPNVKSISNRFPISPNVCYRIDSWAISSRPCYLPWASMRSIMKSNSTKKGQWPFRTICVWSCVSSNSSVRCDTWINKAKHVYVRKRRKARPRRAITPPSLLHCRSNCVESTSIHRWFSTNHHGNISVWILNCRSNTSGNTSKQSLRSPHPIESFSSSMIRAWRIVHRCYWSRTCFSRLPNGWNSSFPSCQLNKTRTRHSFHSHCAELMNCHRLARDVHIVAHVEANVWTIVHRLKQE